MYQALLAEKEKREKQKGGGGGEGREIRAFLSLFPPPPLKSLLPNSRRDIQAIQSVM